MAAPVHRPLWQRFLLFLLPLMLSNILQSLSGTVNSIYIGQLLGVEALAAVSTFFPIMILLISFIVGLASGSTVLTYRPTAPTQPMAAQSISPTGGSQPHDNMVPFLCINYIISLFGIFPQQT